MPIETIPPEAFLAAFPEPVARIGERLRALVRQAVPDAQERVRLGWHLVGFDAPRHPDAGEGRGRPAYFAYIAPETHHVHLGFEHGYAMQDPGGHLQGEGVTRQVRWLTFVPGDEPDPAIVRPLLLEARRVALLSRAERFEAAMAAAGAPTGPGALADDPGLASGREIRGS
jgi:hypothetical protein